MFWKRKPKCEHEWHHIQDDYISINAGASIDLDDACWIFCPKCKKEDLVYKNEWLRIKKIQEVLNNRQTQ